MRRRSFLAFTNNVSCQKDRMSILKTTQFIIDDRYSSGRQSYTSYQWLAQFVFAFSVRLIYLHDLCTQFSMFTSICVWVWLIGRVQRHVFHSNACVFSVRRLLQRFRNVCSRASRLQRLVSNLWPRAEMKAAEKFTHMDVIRSHRAPT